MNTAPEKDIFEMTDEEVMNMASAPASTSNPAVTPEEPLPEPEVQEPVVAEVPVEEPPVEEPPKEEVPTEEPNPLAAADDKVPESAVPPGSKEPDKKPAEEPQKPAEEGKAPTTPEEAKTPPEAAEEVKEAPVLTVEEKAAALDSLMEFKANGKTIKLRSPDEVLRLAQMGANYTKKMVQLQPVMRLHKMLENNKLLDPEQLSYLIDLHQRKPEAIQKLLADSNFDPMTIDAEKAEAYRPTNHEVTDTEVQFDEVLREVEATETGPELISEIANQWDVESRRALYREPGLLSALAEQRSLGLYTLISEEIKRRQMLGDLKGVPFLQAYDAVGHDLQKSGKLQAAAVAAAPATTPAAKEEPKVPQKQVAPVETRPKVPEPKVKSSAQAQAASAPRTKPDAKEKIEENYLEMPDSQFLQEIEGRL